MPRNRRPGRKIPQDTRTSPSSRKPPSAVSAPALPPAVLARMAALRRRAYQAVALAGFAYAVLVLIMWGAFNPHGGFPYENSFPYMSETRSALKGFLFPGDALRIQMN